jgi:hypothetical protein
MGRPRGTSVGEDTATVRTGHAQRLRALAHRGHDCFLRGRTGASQILLVFDTCHAQAGALPALSVVDRVLADLPPDSPRVWVGVVTSALELEWAKDGVFGAQLVRLLRDGPRNNELRLRWSAHSQGVRGDDIIDALLKEWDIPDQQPNGYMAGNAWVMLPNPLYDPDAPERVVEHLLLAAQGRAPDEEGCTSPAAPPSWTTSLRG